MLYLLKILHLFSVASCIGFVLSTPGLITKRNLDMNDVSSAHGMNFVMPSFPSFYIHATPHLVFLFFRLPYLEKA